MKINKEILIIPILIILSACQKGDGTEQLIAYVEAETRLIAAPQSGWITDQHVKEGESVAMNDLLFSLDNTAQKAQLKIARQKVLAAQAVVSDLEKGVRPEELDTLMSQLQSTQAENNLAEAELSRVESLLEKDLVSTEQYDQAKAQVAVTQGQVDKIKSEIKVAGLGARIDQLIQAKAHVDSAKAELDVQQYQLSQRRIKSMVSGEVEEILFHKGEYVVSGSPVLIVRMLHQNKVRFYVNQDTLPHIKLNQIIKVKADGLDNAIQAKVSYISSTAEYTPPVIYSKDSRQKLVFLIEAKMTSEQELHAGLPVDILL